MEQSDATRNLGGAGDNFLLSAELQDEAEHGTSCYLCYAQCVNFGVHGKAVRPCARGFSEYIEQRRRSRRNILPA